METNIIKKSGEFVKKFVKDDPDHGWDHLQRVWYNAKYIIKKEKIKNIDLELLRLANLFHDLGRIGHKVMAQEDDHEIRGAKIAYQFLHKLKYSKDKIVSDMVAENPKGRKLKEFQILKDADVLDVVGLIGVGRTFIYSGQINRGFDNSIERLEYKTWKDKIYTKTARKIAQKRRKLTRKFIDQLKKELEDLKCETKWSLRQKADRLPLAEVNLHQNPNQ